MSEGGDEAAGGEVVGVTSGAVLALFAAVEEALSARLNGRFAVVDMIAVAVDRAATVSQLRTDKTNSTANVKRQNMAELDLNSFIPQI